MDFRKTFVFEWRVDGQKRRTQFQIDKMTLDTAKFDIIGEQVEMVMAQAGIHHVPASRVREAIRDSDEIGDRLLAQILPSGDVVVSAWEPNTEVI